MRVAILVLMGLVLGGLFCPAEKASAQAPTSSGTVITVAGNGTPSFAGDGGLAVDASLYTPYGMAVGPDGTLYIADASNYRIRAVDPVTGLISTVAGDGSGYFDDGSNGDNGPATEAQLAEVYSLAIDPQSNILYLPNFSIARVRQVDLESGVISNFAGVGAISPYEIGEDGFGGAPTAAWLWNPEGIATGPGHDVVFTDWGRSRLVIVDGSTNILTKVAGGDSGPNNPIHFTAGDDGLAFSATLGVPDRVAVDNAGNIFLVDHGGSGQTDTIRRVDAATGIITRIAGGGANPPSAAGAATDVDFTSIQDIALDGAGSLYLANLNQIYKLTLSTGQFELFAGMAAAGFSGDGGPASDAQFFGIGGLTVVPGGGLLVGDSVNQRVRYIAPDSIHLVGDASQTEFHLPWVSEISGDVTLSNNPNLTVIDLNSLSTVTGDLTIFLNPSTTVIDLNSLSSVGGDLILETSGAGMLDLSAVTVGGHLNLTADGYTQVAAATADGETAVTMINSEATMEVTLPDGAFSSDVPVAFHIERLPGGVETVAGETITQLATYAFDFAIPTLDSAAELNFEIDLAAMDEPDRLSLLDLLHEGALLTLGVIGDAPGSELQLFDVCSGGGPVADACVVVQWLDENRMVLDPLGGIDPSILRLEGLVGHFSTYSFVAVTSVPEPATFGLVLFGLVSFAWQVRAKHRSERESISMRQHSP